jgi:hypothetical protein
MDEFCPGKKKKALTYVSHQRNSLHCVIVSIIASLTEKVGD